MTYSGLAVVISRNARSKVIATLASTSMVSKAIDDLADMINQWYNCIEYTMQGKTSSNDQCPQYISKFNHLLNPFL